MAGGWPNLISVVAFVLGLRWLIGIALAGRPDSGDFDNAAAEPGGENIRTDEKSPGAWNEANATDFGVF